MRIVFCFILGCLPHFLFAQSILPPSQIIVSDSALSHLVAAVKIPTISYQEDSVSNPKAFEDFYNLLVKNFPLVFNHLKCERFPTNSILLKWEGTSSSLKPIMYLAHQDVVPVEDQNIKWIFPPFSAQIDSGYVHGRGTMDDKGSLLGLLEDLAQGMPGQVTIFFIRRADIPADPRGDVTYVGYVVSYRLEKEEKERLQMVVGGDHRSVTLEMQEGHK